jgi:hypothetical protein
LQPFGNLPLLLPHRLAFIAALIAPTVVFGPVTWGGFSRS